MWCRCFFVMLQYLSFIISCKRYIFTDAYGLEKIQGFCFP